MIVHAVGNRALLLGFVLPQIFGRLPASQDMSTWLLVAGLEVVFLLLVIAGWRALKLDRESSMNREHSQRRFAQPLAAQQAPGATRLPETARAGDG